MEGKMVNVSKKKMSAAAIGLPLAVIAVWAIEAFSTIKVPGEVAASMGAVLTFVASILIPDEVEE